MTLNRGPRDEIRLLRLAEDLFLGSVVGVQRVVDGRWGGIASKRLRPRGKSEHLQTTRRVEYAGAQGESLVSRKVSQKTNRPFHGTRSLRETGHRTISGMGKGEKAG